MKNKEIEIKYKTTKEKFFKLLEKYKLKYTYLGKFSQNDRYYNSKKESFIEEDGFIYKWLRIREENEKSIVTFKDVSKFNKGREKTEYETEISNSEQMENIFESLGYTFILEIQKTRNKVKINNEIEVDFDEVKDLGYFVEIEYKGKSSNLEEINEILENFAKESGLEKNSEQILGYAHQTLIDQGLTESPI